MKGTKATVSVRLLWSLFLGVGLALGLLWVMQPRSAVGAPAIRLGLGRDSISGQEQRQAVAAAQDVNPGFTVDLTYDAVYGLVSPGDLVTVARTAGGAAYGVAEADGVGFFWTPLWQSSGQQADVAGGDTLAVYVDGALSATMSPQTIAGQMDVLNDRVVGTISGDTGGTPVTVSLGIWVNPQSFIGTPQATATTDGSGIFTATFTNDLGPHNYARVEYAGSPGTVLGYLYPPEVFNVDTLGGAWGYTAPGQTVTVTLVRGGTPVDSATAVATGPHGWYWADIEVEPDDVVEVDLGGGTVITTVASNLTAHMDVDAEQVTGTCPPDETVRVWAWNWRLSTYAETSATADSSGNYTATFSGYDLKASDSVYPSFADDEGDEVLLSTAPPRITAVPEGDGVGGSGDAPNVPYTLTLYHAPDIYVQTGTTQLAFNSIGWNDFGGVDVAPGDVITLETATWSGSMVVADLGFDFDTAGDRVLGEADIPGWAAAWLEQWRGWQYPVHGRTGVTAAVSSPFTATLTGFDLRDGGYARIEHHDANDFCTFVERDVQYFEVNLPYGVGGVPPSAGEAVTATLYTAAGGFLASASDDHDGNPWRFWLDDFGPYPIEPGNWVTVTSASGWTAGLQVPDLSIEADREDDLVWGQGPKSLLYVEGGGGDSGFYVFVPGDDYVVDAAFFGHDLQWGDWVDARYLALDGNQVRREYPWPRITARYEMDGRNTVFGRNAIPGNTIAITVTDELVVDSGTTYPGSGWEGSTSYALDFADGTLVPSHTVTVDFGDGFVDSVHVVTITGYPDPDTDVVTGTAPPEGRVDAWGEHRWGDQRNIDDVQVDASGVYTLDFGAEGWDIQYGDEFHVYYAAPRNHQVEYVFWLPAPDLGVEKETTPGVARPGGTYLYRIRYRNEGNGLAENVIITDALPSGTPYLTDTSGFPVTDGGSAVTWTLSTVPPDAEGEFYVAVTVGSGVPTQTHLSANCAGIATTTPGDYNAGDDWRCSGEAWVDEGDVGVWVEKWPGPDDPHPGQEFIYEIEYGSDGGAATGPVWLTDTLPLSTTFVRWEEDRGWGALWTEVVTTGGQFVLKAPAGMPGDMGGRIRLTLRLDDDVPIGTWLENNVVVSTAGDVDPGNNEDTDTDARASGPRYDMRLEKGYNSGVLVPGGRIDYHVRYENRGNVATQAWVTDTLPPGTFYVPGNARWQDGGPPFEPAVVGNRLVWDLGQVGVRQEYGFDVTIDISDTVSPGTVLTNCATVGITPTENMPWDNTFCVAETVYTSGLNLRVTKWHDWQNDDTQLEYQIYAENIGTQRLEDIWITDTYPISTTFNDDWWVDHGPWITPTHDAPNRRLILWAEELDPGQTTRIRVRVDLDDPDARPRWYTNTVEIQTPPGDVNPADNAHTDVAVKGEVDRAEMRVGTDHGDMWGEAQSGTTVTVTTAYTQVTAWADPDCDGCWNTDDMGPIWPGDTVTVEAGSGLLPVVIPVPDPFTAHASSITDTVWGQIDALYHEEIAVDLDDGPRREVWTDDSGNYSATFDPVPRGGDGEVRYGTEIAHAEVVFHRDFQTPDLAVTVDYGDDWMSGDYEPGHTLWITVTESDGFTLKATAVLTTGPIPWWGGNSGFSTRGEDWLPAYPDIEPGDWVYGLLDNGYTTTVQVGTIDGQVDPDVDVVSGTIHASWFSPTGLTVRCEIHEDNGESVEDHDVDPDGGGFECNFGGRFDILPGHNVAVNYTEPDGDRVQTRPPNPAPDLRVEKWVEGGGETSPGGTVVYGIRYYNNRDGEATGVVLTDTLPPTTTYGTDSSRFTPYPSGDTVTWDLGTLAPGSQGRFYLVLDVDGGAVPSDTIASNVITITAGNYEPGDWQGDNRAESGDIHVGSGSPDLYVNKHVSPNDPAPGQTFLYQINYGNQGPAASGPVLLTDTLPLSTTFVSWFSDNGYTLWTEEITSGGQFVLSAPALPGHWGDQIYLRLRVGEAVTYNTQLTNTVEITTAGDDDPNNNRDMRDDVWVRSPRWDVGVDKSWGGGQLVPGGQIDYNIHYRNNGNVAAQTWLTDTLPAGTTFLTSTQWTGYDNVPLEPSHVGGGIVAWDLGVLEPNEWGNLNLRLAISRTLAPDTVITNCATIAITQTDSWPYNNTACVVEAVRDAGPNLRVRKESWWDWEGQIDYRIRVENVGTTRMEDVWITDTYPISTTFNDDWWVEHGPWITHTHDAPNRQLVFWAQDLNLGNSASIRFRVDVDGSLHGVQGLIFTNTVDAPWPGDVNPADNSDVELAYTGPDVYVEKWLSGGELRARETVTFTVEFGNRNSWWSGDDSYGSHITDTLPPEMEFITATARGDPSQPWTPEEITGNTIRWGLGTMWSNSTWYFDVVAQITDTVRPYDVMTNTVEAYGDSPTDVEAFWDNNVFDLVLTVPLTNTPPLLSGLPDRLFTHTTSLPGTTDLWSHAWDAESEPDELTYTVEGPPPAGAGVTIDSNRTVIVNPSASWCGGTDVTIRATDPDGLWDEDTFRVAVSWSCPGPLAPTLVSPRDGSTVTSARPTFAWEAVADAEQYHIQVDDDAGEEHPGDFSSPELDEMVVGTEYTPASGLSDGIYTWQVRASNAAGVGDWSARRELTVRASSPAEFEIYLPLVVRSRP